MRTDIMTNVQRSFSKISLKCKKHAPEGLIIAGVVGVVTSTVMACKATTKVNDILVETNEQLEPIHNARARLEAGEVIKCKDGSEYTDKDLKKDLTIVYTQAAVKYIKLYGPSVALGAASIGCIVWSHCILNKRNAALAAAYAVVDKSFKDYRGRVVERFGKELDKELRFNTKSKEFESVVKNEDGTETTEKETVEISTPSQYSDYARCFCEGCTGWSKDPEYNLLFLRRQQDHANELLQKKGYLFLNEVYEMLGIPVTSYGQIVGWIYDEEHPIGDNYVDFGIYNLNVEKNRDFVNGWERSIWLDFNVDGNILENL